MNALGQKAKELFIELISHIPATEWDKRLAERCAGDHGLELRVQALLRAHRNPDRFLSEPAAYLDLERQVELPPERPGIQIGKYQLLEQIGEGGFGVVFMAEQLVPLRRKVA